MAQSLKKPSWTSAVSGSVNEGWVYFYVENEKKRIIHNFKTKPRLIMHPTEKILKENELVEDSK